jgi:hypothetical protein
MGTINSSDRIAVKLYSLRTWFVSGIYIPCIKEIVYLPIIIIIIIIIIMTVIIVTNNIVLNLNFNDAVAVLRSISILKLQACQHS